MWRIGRTASENMREVLLMNQPDRHGRNATAGDGSCSAGRRTPYNVHNNRLEHADPIALRKRKLGEPDDRISRGAIDRPGRAELVGSGVILPAVVDGNVYDRVAATYAGVRPQDSKVGIVCAGGYRNRPASCWRERVLALPRARTTRIDQGLNALIGFRIEASRG